MPEYGKSERVVTFPSDAFGTVPAGGVTILRINIVCQSHGIDIVVSTDNVVITISIP